jgi:hypothetical protein
VLDRDRDSIGVARDARPSRGPRARSLHIQVRQRSAARRCVHAAGECAATPHHRVPPEERRRGAGRACTRSSDSRRRRRATGCSPSPTSGPDAP